MLEEFAAMFGMDVFSLSIILIIIAVIVIAISIIVNIIFTKKSKEEAVAVAVLKNVDLIAKGKLVPKSKAEEKKEGIKEGKEEEKKEEKIVAVEKTTAKNDGITLKEHLSQKFQPLIEKQLKTKIKLLDFSGKGNQFQALVEVGGVKVLLILDSSGKIIDYKKK